MTILLSLVIAIFLESSIFSLPLVLIVILISAVFIRESYVFLLAFAGGLVLDILTQRTLGLSSLYFVAFVFIIFLYHKKFEAGTFQFLTAASFLGSLFYLFFIGTGQIIFHSIIIVLFTVTSFLFFKKSNKMAGV